MNPPTITAQQLAERAALKMIKSGCFDGGVFSEKSDNAKLAQQIILEQTQLEALCKCADVLRKSRKAMNKVLNDNWSAPIPAGLMDEVSHALNALNL